MPLPVPERYNRHSMLEYRTIVPPYAPSFFDELTALGTEVFGQFDPTELVWRLTHMPDPSVQVASDQGLVGFKLGYASGRDRYHSWLGGVRQESRRRGIAVQLMNLQHEWLRSRGYTSVGTATLPENVAMIALNMRFGFRVIGSQCQADRPRVLLSKNLAERD
ncbi:MAG TPA: GNAT family N-acetyltransferase [Polyangiaceae bacterium]|nr:GNAT family N-acetyltransferase [Polyangiaceae bacterium]